MRVSTEEQAKEGFSIDAQRRVLEAQAIVNGFDETLCFIDEGKSGKNLRRPQVQQLMEACRQREVTAVIVWRLDRLSRSLRDTLTLIEDIFTPNGIALISATESIDTSTPSGRLMINVLASFAQNEREVNQQRVTMVMQDLAKQCRHLGGIPPFGYQIVDGFYQIDPVTAPAVQHLFDMFIDGAGYSAMLAWLNEHGYRTARGNAFGKNSLHDLLGNEKYTGVYIYNRTIAASKDGVRNNHESKPDAQIIRIPGGIPAIISTETWQKAQAIRAVNKKRPGSYRAKQTYLLSGICFCEACGSKLAIISGSKDRNGTIQRYYACPNRCVTAARKEEIESATFAILSAFLQNETILQQAADIAAQFILSQDNSEELNDLHRQIQSIEQKTRHMLTALQQDGGAAPVSIINEVRTLDAQRLALEEMAQAAKHPGQADTQRLISTLRAAVNAKDRPLAEQKPLIQRAVSCVAVSDTSYRVYLDCSLSGGADPILHIVCTAHRAKRRLLYTYPYYCDTNDIYITLHIINVYHNSFSITIKI